MAEVDLTPTQAQIKNSLDVFYKNAPTNVGLSSPEQAALNLGQSLGVSIQNSVTNGIAGAISLGAYNLSKFVVDRLKHLKVKSDLDSRSYSEAYKAANGSYESSIEFAKQQREYIDFDTIDIRDILYASNRVSYPRYPDWLKITGDVNTTRGLIIPVEDFDNSFINFDRSLVFQFNPTQITDTKLVNYENRPYVGHDAIKTIWGSGGKRTLKFSLTFDASVITTQEEDLPTHWLKEHYRSSFGEYGKPRTGNDLTENNIDFISVSEVDGTLTPVSRLQSYMYSEVIKSQRRSTIRFQNGLFSPTNRFSSPPVLYFMFGIMVFVCVVEDVQVVHELYHKKGFPIRSTCEVTLHVHEWDIPSNISDGARDKLNAQRSLLTPATNTQNIA